VIRSTIAFAAMMCAAAAVSAQTTPQIPASEGPVVVSSGEAVVKRAPDRAWVTVTAESRARTPTEAQKLNAEAMSAVLQKLKGAGLPADAIQTRGYDLQPEYDYNEGRQRLRGYLARNSVEVRVDELARVGELLDIAVTSGATSVGGVRFDLKDRSGAEREALRLAVEDARRRADAAASGAGMKVDRVLRISEQRADVVPPPRPYMMEARTSAMKADAAPPVAPGELEIQANVTLVCAIR
jgi:uncharacterized protein YggE